MRSERGLLVCVIVLEDSVVLLSSGGHREAEGGFENTNKHSQRGNGLFFHFLQSTSSDKYRICDEYKNIYGCVIDPRLTNVLYLTSCFIPKALVLGNVTRRPISALLQQSVSVDVCQDHLSRSG